ncbi:MAG: hypothetical protein ABFD69_13525 [Candidatus Sumerlaeia bacterium]
MKAKNISGEELRAEYVFDYSKAERGKYAKSLARKGSNAVLLDPDVAKVFRDSTAVNDALRSVLALIQTTERSKKRATRSLQGTRKTNPSK